MAWNYYGDDAYFHGAIKLGYWKIWLVMGLIYNPGLYLIKNLYWLWDMYITFYIKKILLKIMFLLYI